MSVLVYVIPYMFSFFSSFGKGRFFAVLTLFYVGVILTVRYGVGYDYQNYQVIQFFGEFSYAPFANLLLEISRALSFPNGFLGLIAVITCAIYIFLATRPAPYRLSPIMFVCLPYFFIDSIGISRQSLAVAFLVLGYYYLLRSKNLIVVGLYALAVLIHPSAIIGLVCLYVTKLSLRRLFTVLVALILSVIAFKLAGVGESRALQIYLEYDLAGNFYVITSGLMMAIAVLSRQRRLLLVGIFGIVATGVIYFEFSYVFFRFLSYIFVPFLFFEPFPRGRKTTASNWAIFGIISFMFFASLYVKISNVENGFVPYETIF